MKNTACVSAVFFVCLLVLSGCEKKQLAKKSVNQAKQTTTQQNMKLKMETENISGDKNRETARNQIREAAQDNKCIKCVYQIVNRSEEDEKGSVEIFIDGDKYRSTSTTEEQTFKAIFDGRTYYSWLLGGENGTKMSSECLKELEVDTQPEEETDGDIDFDSFKTIDEILDQNLNMQCEEVETFDLELPEDIEFVDQCNMLKNQIQMIEKMKF